MSIKEIHIKQGWSHFKLKKNGSNIQFPWILCIYQRKWIENNEFSIRKKAILNPLEILCMPQNIWTEFVFYSSNCLVPVWILSYQESTVAALISSLYIYNICLLACKTDSFLKSTHSWDAQHKTNNGIFVQLSKKPPYFCHHILK